MSNLTSTVQQLSTSLTAIKPNNSETTQLITYTLIATAVQINMVNWKDYLPDLKGSLKGFYEENVKETVEGKSAYYENLLKENIAFSQRTQKIAIALGVGIFLLLAIAYF
ncbi:8187_t:CDS:2 [Ambispora gerdemannii]|uniref:8187_t:CDS:1 n=1 Tax=Ambispora gerdemannii TaxID=144530 RepID=A0A9N9H3K9_9GLOM|nr:8187_t:CDS:2 [Ambispora gerdemannii]